MTNEEYIRHELLKGAPKGPDDRVATKLCSPYGESRWVTLPHHVLDLVTVMASLTWGQAEAMRKLLHDTSRGRGDYSPDTQQHVADIHRLILDPGHTETQEF